MSLQLLRRSPLFFTRSTSLHSIRRTWRSSSASSLTTSQRQQRQLPHLTARLFHMSMSRLSADKAGGVEEPRGTKKTPKLSSVEEAELQKLMEEQDFFRSSKKPTSEAEEAMAAKAAGQVKEEVEEEGEESEDFGEEVEEVDLMEQARHSFDKISDMLLLQGDMTKFMLSQAPELSYEEFAAKYGGMLSDSQLARVRLQKFREETGMIKKAEPIPEEWFDAGGQNVENAASEKLKAFDKQAEELMSGIATTTTSSASGSSSEVVTIPPEVRDKFKAIIADLMRFIEGAQDRDITPFQFNCVLLTIRKLSRYFSQEQSILAEVAHYIFMTIMSRQVPVNEDTFNLVLSILAVHRQLNRISFVIEIMFENGFLPTIETWSILMDCCVRTEQFEAGFNFYKVLKRFQMPITISVYNSLILLCKFAPDPKTGLEAAQQIIQEIRKQGLQPSVTTMNNMLRVMLLAGLNNRKDLLKFVTEMKRHEAVQPNKTTKQLIEQGVE